MPVRVTLTPSESEDDGGLRYARTLEEAFGCGHRAAIIYEPDMPKSDYAFAKRLLARLTYAAVVLMLIGMAYGSIRHA